MVTLKPLHALVSGVMDGVGQPHLLLTGQESPHTYTLKPSQVKLLAKMDLVVWLGPSVENFLEKPLTNLNEKVVTLNLLQTPHLTLFKIRSGETWVQHSESAEEQSHHIHQAEQTDGHIWLNPDNAQVIVQAIAQKLGEMDSAHAEIYQTNANRLIQRLKAFSQNLREELVAIQDQPYLVFHDAYQYFEKYYGLNAKGAITISPEVPLSPRRLSEIREKIKQLKIVCVFSEPQFSPPVLATVVEGMNVKQGTLDPLGVDLPAGTESYFTLLQTLATHLTTCLTDQDVPTSPKRGIRG
jgi:zinc transport system substrate-binding protein